MLRTVDVGAEPEGVRLRPDGATVYVTSETDHAVTVVDARSGAVLDSIEVGWRPRDAVFSADGSRAYVSSEHGGSVAVVDVAANRVLETITLPAGSLPMGLALVAGWTPPVRRERQGAHGLDRRSAGFQRRRRTCGSVLGLGVSG